MWINSYLIFCSFTRMSLTQKSAILWHSLVLPSLRQEDFCPCLKFRPGGSQSLPEGAVVCLHHLLWRRTYGKMRQVIKRFCKLSHLKTKRYYYFCTVSWFLFKILFKVVWDTMYVLFIEINNKVKFNYMSISFFPNIVTLLHSAEG